MAALIVIAVVAVIVLAVLWRTVRIVPQARAGVVERLGRYSRTLSPGLALVVPFVDRVRPLLDLREQVVSFPPQPVITEDNLVVNIDSVIYFQVTDAKAATYEIANYIQAIEQLTVTTLRNVIGGMALEKTLTSRDEINGQLRGVLDEATGKWGIRVNRVELKAIDPPASIQDSMEKQMRADREKRATILQAEGQKQSQILTAEGEKQAAILRAEGERAVDDPAGRGPGEGDRHRLPGDPRRQPRPAAPRLPVPPDAAADRAGRRRTRSGSSRASSSRRSAGSAAPSPTATGGRRRTGPRRGGEAEALARLAPLRAARTQRRHPRRCAGPPGNVEPDEERRRVVGVARLAQAEVGVRAVYEPVVAGGEHRQVERTGPRRRPRTGPCSRPTRPSSTLRARGSCCRQSAGKRGGPRCTPGDDAEAVGEAEAHLAVADDEGEVARVPQLVAVERRGGASGSAA